jgi:hypothetical protein
VSESDNIPDAPPTDALSAVLNATVEDEPSFGSSDTGTPNFRAGRTRSRRIPFGKPAGDRRDDAAKKSRGGTTARVRVIPNKRGQFVEPLSNTYAMIGGMIFPFDAVCGNAIVQSAPKCAETLDELAYRNEAVRRALWALTTTSVMGAVFMAHLPIIMAIVIHHVPAAQRVLGNAGQEMAEAIAKRMAESQVRFNDDEPGTPNVA